MKAAMCEACVPSVCCICSLLGHLVLQAFTMTTLCLVSDPFAMIGTFSTNMMLLQVDVSDPITSRKIMTRIRLLERAYFGLLERACRAGKKIEEHSLAKASLLSCGLEAVHQGQLHSVC